MELSVSSLGTTRALPRSCSVSDWPRSWAVRLARELIVAPEAQLEVAGWDEWLEYCAGDIARAIALGKYGSILQNKHLVLRAEERNATTVSIHACARLLLITDTQSQ